MTTPQQDPPDRLRVGGWIPAPAGDHDGPPVRAAEPRPASTPEPTAGQPTVVAYPAPALPDEVAGAPTPGRRARRRQQRRRTPVTAIAGAVAVVAAAVVAGFLRGDGSAGRADPAAATTAPPPSQVTADTGLGPGPSPTGTAVPGAPPPSPSNAPSPSATPSAGGPLTLAFEAESALLIGAAEVLAQPEASGGRLVHQIGTDPGGRAGAVTFNQMSIPRAGRYALTVHYVSAEERNALLTVNDQRPLLLRFPPTPGWNAVGSQTFTVELRAGPNRIAVSNPAGWAPRLDRITLLG